MLIAFYISSHGLGHASRSIELIGTLLRQLHDVRIIVRTKAPAWLFDRITSSQLEVQECDVDSGIVQIDSLHIDEDRTAQDAAEFYRQFDRRVDDEAAWLRSVDATIVLGDVPPLAFAAAPRAGVPSVAIANFTWDWMYAFYPEFQRLAPGVIDTIQDAYAGTTLALRLPIHGGFAPMLDVTHDTPFIARRSARDPADTRRILGLDTQRPIVLASFGAVGIELPNDGMAASGLTVIEEKRLPAGGLRYEDLVAAADVVVSRPGYGIVSDCAANNTALLYTSRGRIAEYDVMVEEMPKVLRCRFIDQAALLAGRWAEPVKALLAQPQPPSHARVDGAAIAAAKIIELAAIPFRR